MIVTELLMTENDSVFDEFRKQGIIRDAFVETSWEAAESDFEVAMVTVDSVNVGMKSDVIFSAEKDVLNIGVIDVNDVQGLLINVAVTEPSLLSGWENETVQFFKGGPVECVEETRYEELVGRTDGVRSDTVAMLLSSGDFDEI